MYFFNRHLILVRGAGLWQHLKMNSCIFLQKWCSRRQWQGMLLLQICLNPDLERSPLEMTLCAHAILDLPAETLSRLPIYDVDPGLESSSSFRVDYQTSCEWWQLVNWPGSGFKPVVTGERLPFYYSSFELTCRESALHCQKVHSFVLILCLFSWGLQHFYISKKKKK